MRPSRLNIEWSEQGNRAQSIPIRDAASTGAGACLESQNGEACPSNDLLMRHGDVNVGLSNS